MKITDSSLQFEASHHQWQRREVSESLRMWVGERSGREPNSEPDKASSRAASTTAPPSLINLSDAGRSAQAADRASSETPFDATEADPVLSLIRLLVAQLTGEDIEVYSAPDSNTAPSTDSSNPTAPPAELSYGVAYDRRESYTEMEQTDFTANGTVRTADGQTITFSLSLSMTRRFHEESSISLRLGNARQVQDPLVINFGGSAARLIDQRFSFDLNADGTASEQINYLAGGAGFLAFDRDGNGRIDNGTELFGARSGDGFAELAKLDSDRNGWIDENDALYAQLSVWSKDVSGTDALLSLKRADVGAIALARAETPFSLKDENNGLLGQIRSSSVYLKDSGGIGSIQQIDFTA